MPAFEAKMVTGKTGWGARPMVIRSTPGGMTAHVDWTVFGTRDPIEAMLFAPALPRDNQPLSALLPGLVCVGREFKPIGGTVNTSAQISGNTWVSLDYSTPQAGGRLPDPIENLAYSRFRSGVTTLNREYDARLELGPEFEYIAHPEQRDATIEKIKGGRGMNVAVGQQQLDIVKWLRADTVRDDLITKMVRLQHFQAVNKLRITVPPMLSTEVRYHFEAGEARYVGFDMDMDRGLLRITQTLALAEDWFFRWRPEDENGAATGDVVISVEYPAMDFGGLW